jgi:DNA-binding MarR family transcriptional regulator
MEQRFSGSIIRKAKEQTSPLPTLGEIGINQFAPYLMNRIAARWNANMAEALKAHDMTTTQMRALSILSLSSSVTINELSVYTVIEQSTLSRTLDTLEEQGLIRRQPRPDDMRIRDVSITEEGRAAFESVWPTMYELFQQLFDGVDEEDYRLFISILHRILRNVRKHEI